ncbi:hypothetical protein MRB53_040566 [Persea americana]|nr:hypothetical protein MRB53_040566 [Persea americana]
MTSEKQDPYTDQPDLPNAKDEYPLPLHWQKAEIEKLRTEHRKLRRRLFFSFSGLFSLALIAYSWFYIVPKDIRRFWRHEIDPVTKSGRHRFILCAGCPMDTAATSRLRRVHTPDSNLTLPRNQGREAMAYLTWIIDNYDNLPTYTFFVHGHEKSWHQPEPIVSNIRAMNLTALDSDQYINLRCRHNPGCAPGQSSYPEQHQSNSTLIRIGTTINMTTEGLRLDDAEPWRRMLTGLWADNFPDLECRHSQIPHSTYIANAPDPDELASTCCAQFAVTRTAILSRSLASYKNLRLPMTRDPTELNWGDPMLETPYNMGLLYEKIWHVIFGMPAFHCPTEEYCEMVQFGNTTRCDRFNSVEEEMFFWEGITCHGPFIEEPVVEEPVVEEQLEVVEEQVQEPQVNAEPEVAAETIATESNDDGFEGPWDGPLPEELDAAVASAVDAGRIADALEATQGGVGPQRRWTEVWLDDEVRR